MTRLAARTSRRWRVRFRRVAALGAVTALLTACEGGSGQSGSAFTFLSVDGFFRVQGEITSSVPSSTSQVTSTIACVTLRNNLKNPTVTAPSTLDNIIVRSYTLTLNGRAFNFGTAVLVPAGTVTMGNVGGNTATFGVVVAPAGAKGGAGSAAIAEFTFRGQDGRGQSVHADGAVTVLFTGGDEPTSTCNSATGGTTGGTTAGTTAGTTSGTP